jgi:hypothetical protein
MKTKGVVFSFEVSSDYAISQKYFKNTNILSTWYESEEGAFVVYDYIPAIAPSNKDIIFSRNSSLPQSYKRKTTLIVRYDPKMNYAAESVVHEKYRTISKPLR